MVGKLLGLRAMSTNTTGNAFCNRMYENSNEKTICSYCYSQSMLRTYRKNMQPCLERNSKLLSSSLLEDRQIPTIIENVFRFHAHGELINEIHFKNFLAITRKNPHCIFTLWTKRFPIINKVLEKETKPKNLILIYSNPLINTLINPMKSEKLKKYFDKTFNNVEHDKFVEEQNCTGQKCMDCLECYSKNDTLMIVEAIKINGRVKKLER
tara:strand:+ start:2059 stop:2688 length:630 start_codon:yes stop_codon:yes gene_type:complete